MIEMRRGVILFATLSYMRCTLVATEDDVCPKPNRLWNGKIEYPSRSVGAIAVYLCNNNYRLETPIGLVKEGENSRKCLSTKRWDGYRLACVPDYGEPLAKAMYKGASVQRGKDWSYGDEDKDGNGIVQNGPPYTDGRVSVKWGNNTIPYHYRLGANRTYDITFKPGTYVPIQFNSKSSLYQFMVYA